MLEYTATLSCSLDSFGAAKFTTCCAVSAGISWLSSRIFKYADPRAALLFGACSKAFEMIGNTFLAEVNRRGAAAGLKSRAAWAIGIAAAANGAAACAPLAFGMPALPLWAVAASLTVSVTQILLDVIEEYRGQKALKSRFLPS